MGRWMKVQGQFKRRAHLKSFIGVHVGVGRRCRAGDEESPAILPIMSTRNVPARRWMKVQGKLKMQAHSISGVVMDIAAIKVSHSSIKNAAALHQNAAALQAARARSSSIGKMERYMRGFDSAQNSRCPATTHRQQ